MGTSKLLHNIKSAWREKKFGEIVSSQKLLGGKFFAFRKIVKVFFPLRIKFPSVARVVNS